MKFSLLLFGLKIMMKRAAKKSEEFRKKLKEKNYTMVIRTEDGKRARYFTFKDGAIISGRGVLSDPEISLVWRDASTGFKILAGGNNNAVMEALKDGGLKLVGDGNLALAFMGLTAEMKKALKM